MPLPEHEANHSHGLPTAQSSPKSVHLGLQCKHTLIICLCVFFQRNQNSRIVTPCVCACMCWVCVCVWSVRCVHVVNVCMCMCVLGVCVEYVSVCGIVCACVICVVCMVHTVCVHAGGYVCKCVCEGVNAHMCVQEHCMCLHVESQEEAVS